MLPRFILLFIVVAAEFLLKLFLDEGEKIDIKS